MQRNCVRVAGILVVLAVYLLPMSVAARWISVDPKANKYPDIGPYTYCANNPLRIIDPNGQELKLTGSQNDIDQTIQVANDGMGPVGTASVDQNGIVKVAVNNNFVGPPLPEQQAMFNTMSASADPNTPTTTIGVTNGSNSVLVGSYNLQQIDIADMQQFGDGPFATAAGKLGHEVAEQTAKQVSGKSDYNAHHQIAVQAENAINGSVRGQQGPTNLTRGAYGISGTVSIPYVKDGKTQNVIYHITNTNITSIVQ
ncbi:hypothetical protein KQH82_12410 [bacterium]|nr:hypothetical protein [bacterium]